MFKWIKKLINSKISITINIVENKPVEEEKYWPSALVMPAPVVIETTEDKLPLTSGCYRFVNDYTKNISGKEEEYWYTEIYENGHWRMVDDTLKFDKQQALDLHLKVIEGTTVQPIKRKTVLWENMPEDKVKTWVAISKSESK